MARASSGVRRQDWRAFTLVELLVAMAVMALLLVLLLQISGSTLQATRASRQQLEASQQSRQALDGLAADLAHVVTENGLSLFAAQDSQSNSRLLFLTRSRPPNVSGGSPARLLAVCYELQGTTLIKRISPVTWTESALPTAIFSAITSNDVIELAQGILRFEAVVVLQDGRVLDLSQPGGWKQTSILGQTIPEPFHGLRLQGSADQRVRSLIVGVAAVDRQSLQLAGTSEIGSDLPSPRNGQTPLEAWSVALDTAAINTTSKSALRALRLDQRSYLLK